MQTTKNWFPLRFIWVVCGFGIQECNPAKTAPVLREVTLDASMSEPSCGECVRLETFLKLAIVCYKVREMFHENGMLRGQLATMKDCLKTVEVELETHRDRVNKLTAEVDDYRRGASLSAIDMDNMRLVCVSCLFVNNTAIRDYWQQQQKSQCVVFMSPGLPYAKSPGYMTGMLWCKQPASVALSVASRYALPGYCDRRVRVQGPGWPDRCVRL